MVDTYLQSINFLEQRLAELNTGCPKGISYADWLQRKSLLESELHDLYCISNYLSGKALSLPNSWKHFDNACSYDSHLDAIFSTD